MPCWHIHWLIATKWRETLYFQWKLLTPADMTSSDHKRLDVVWLPTREKTTESIWSKERTLLLCYLICIYTTSWIVHTNTKSPPECGWFAVTLVTPPSEKRYYYGNQSKEHLLTNLLTRDLQDKITVCVCVNVALEMPHDVNSHSHGISSRKEFPSRMHLQPQDLFQQSLYNSLSHRASLHK